VPEFIGIAGGGWHLVIHHADDCPVVAEKGTAA
jgi:hypothetical protein